MSSSTPTSNQTAPGVEPALAAELLDIVDGTARLDERHRQEQPDWKSVNCTGPQGLVLCPGST